MNFYKNLLRDKSLLSVYKYRILTWKSAKAIKSVFSLLEMQNPITWLHLIKCFLSKKRRFALPFWRKHYISLHSQTRHWNTFSFSWMWKNFGDNVFECLSPENERTIVFITGILKNQLLDLCRTKMRFAF